MKCALVALFTYCESNNQSLNNLVELQHYEMLQFRIYT